MNELLKKVREMRSIQFRYERAARLGYVNEVAELLKQKISIEAEVDALIKADQKKDTTTQPSIF